MEISPDILQFHISQSRSYDPRDHIILMNRSQRDYLFKIKTTNPKSYCVRPTLGVIERNKMLVIDVSYLDGSFDDKTSLSVGFSGTPSGKSGSDTSRSTTMSPSFRLSSESGSGNGIGNGNRLKSDKFLVLCLPLPHNLRDEIDSLSDVWMRLEAEFSEEVISKKIKVAFFIGDGVRSSPMIPEWRRNMTDGGKREIELGTHVPPGVANGRQVPSDFHSDQKIIQYDVPLASKSDGILIGAHFIARNVQLLMFVLIVVVSLSMLYY